MTGGWLSRHSLNGPTACKSVIVVFMTRFHVFTQVPVGVLSAGNAATLSSSKYPGHP